MDKNEGVSKKKESGYELRRKVREDELCFVF